MSIATKTGDKGETSLIGGERVRKNDVRIEAYGTVDELNAAIGVSLCYVTDQKIRESLSQIQHQLFTIGAELAALTSKKLTMTLPRITSEHTAYLEKLLYPLEQELPTQKAFILPHGTEAGAHLHLARTICRRAERALLACQQHTPDPEITKYLNRLGDLLFLFARKENHGKMPEEEVRY